MTVVIAWKKELERFFLSELLLVGSVKMPELKTP
jgi:hypothetical protein